MSPVNVHLQYEVISCTLFPVAAAGGSTDCEPGDIQVYGPRREYACRLTSCTAFFVGHCG